LVHRQRLRTEGQTYERLDISQRLTNRLTLLSAIDQLDSYKTVPSLMGKLANDLANIDDAEQKRRVTELHDLIKEGVLRRTLRELIEATASGSNQLRGS
jgi:hypothetical protein